MTTRHQAFPRMLITAAVAVGLGVGAAPNATSDDQDLTPFSKLSCTCPPATPADSTDLPARIHRGMREGFAAELPGLPPATRVTVAPA